MTSKKRPPSKPPEPPARPEDALAGQPLEVIIDVLAKVSGELKGLEGGELKRHVVRVANQLQDMTTEIENKMAAEATRKEAAAEVERFVDLLVRTGTQAGKAIEKHRGPIANAFKGADIQKLADAMKLIADFMANPSEQNEQQAKALVSQLEVTMGPMIGYDPARAEQERRDAIKEDVRKRLDDVMKTQDFKPKIKPFEPPPTTVTKKDDKE